MSRVGSLAEYNSGVGTNKRGFLIAILGAGSSYPQITGAMPGLEGQTLAFWIAYTVDDDPELLVYGSEPIRVEWTLE